MTASLDAIRENGVKIDKEDIQRLSPVGHEHINIVGRYSFQLPEEVENGALRSLIKIDDIKGVGMLLPFLFRYYTNPKYILKAI